MKNSMSLHDECGTNMQFKNTALINMKPPYKQPLRKNKQQVTRKIG